MQLKCMPQTGVVDVHSLTSAKNESINIEEKQQ